METIDVPFQMPVAFIPEAVTGMSREMGEQPPVDGAAQIDLFNRWVKKAMKQCITNERYQAAANSVNTSDVDAW